MAAGATGDQGCATRLGCTLFRFTAGSAWLLPTASTTLQWVEGTNHSEPRPFPTRVYTLTAYIQTAEEKQATRKI